VGADARKAAGLQALARLAGLPAVGHAAAAQALSKQLTALTTAGRSLDDMRSKAADNQVTQTHYHLTTLLNAECGVVVPSSPLWVLYNTPAPPVRRKGRIR
jgi:hypothetical protein